MPSLLQDLRYALRQFAKNPGFTLATVLTLGLGIGFNTAIFSLVNGVLLRPLPYQHGERLVHLGYRAPAPGVESAVFSVPDLLDFRQQSQTLAGVVEYHSMAFTLLGKGEPDRVQTGVVSADFFQSFGVEPLQGRMFRPEDERPGAHPVLVLSHDYWRRRFGGDPGILGRTLTMNDRPITVVGILPPLPPYPGKDDVYMPTSACPFRSQERIIHARGARLLTLFGRLKPGASLAQAQADVSTIAARLQREYANTYPEGHDPSVPLMTVREELTGRFRPTLLILLGAVTLVLVIACANVANHTLARLLSREREVVVRVAMGAGRGRLVRQLLTESTLLALAGGALGLLMAVAGVRLLVAFASRFTPRTGDIGFDGTVLLFALAVSLLTGLLFGIIPALQISRQNLATALREGSGKATAGAAKHRFRNLLVVAQVAVSFVLLVAAGLTIRSFLKLQQVDSGFDPENVLTVEISLPFSKYTNPPQMLGFYQPLLERLGSRPGVVSAAMASDIPLRGDLFSPGIRVEGRQADPRQPEPTATFHTVTPDYFRTLGIALRRGRVFNGSDQPGAPPVVIVNESLSRLHWPGEDPVGKRMEIPMFGGGMRTVVGVVADVKQHGLDMEAGPSFYLPFLEFPGDGRLLFRTAADPAGLAQDVRAAVHQLDPEVPVADVRTLAQVRSEWMAPSRLTALLLSLLAGLAFAITALGISGVIAFSVAERTQEIGIRSVLGAARGDLVGMVLRQGLALVLAGIALGAFGAFYLSRLVSSLLFGVEPTDPLTFAAVSVALLLIVTVACFIPARRATSIDPLQALRY